MFVGKERGMSSRLNESMGVHKKKSKFFLDDQSYGTVVPDEDALQENGMDESAPDVPNGAEKQTE